MLDLFEDIERMNFIAWYSRATTEDMAKAIRNNGGRFFALLAKYWDDIKAMEALNML